MANDLEEIRLNGTRYGINDERLATKAEQDGFYEEMTVGDAEQLVSTKYVNDAEPYNFRTTGGSADVGNREYLDKIVGGTVAWNQLCGLDNAYPTGNSGNIIRTNNDDGSFTLNGTTEYTQSVGLFNLGTSVFNHVLLAQFNHSGGCTDVHGFIQVQGQGAEKRRDLNNTDTVMLKCTPTSAIRYDLSLYFLSGASADNLVVKPNVIDLTQMFGATIADYIYSLETATEGAGAAFFRKLFPKSYYAYNAGELISVKTSAHNTVGFNQWDEEWEVGGISDSTGANITNTDRFRSKNYVSVLPNTTYYFRCSVNHRIFYYDESKQYISASAVIGYADAFVTPSNCHFMRFFAVGTTYNNDICINLSWSGWRNGEYEPYVKHEYALDSDLELRGIPKLDSANNLYYDGDEYQSDGGVARKYGIVDLGTLSYGKSASGLFFTDALTGIAKGSDTLDVGNIVSSIYVAMNSNDITGPSGTNPSPNMVMAINNQGRLYLNNTSYSDETEFKTAMSGVYLVYELATPTTETADAYNEMQICDDFGTEEFVDTRDVPVPVGHETRYPANLRDKLQHLPDLADADGYYMIQQSNHAMSLIRFRIPQAPAEDGEYILKATVSGGTPTYTWESTESEGE